MGFIEKIKSSVEMWRIEKYTKRRPVTSPDFEQKDREFYRQHYKDGVYLHQQPNTTPNGSMINTISRKTTLLRSKSEKILRSSENYNNNAR
ncbi:hypothetical protein BD770DRAFT_395877 [Pilaira anomala]|nr:hypothetical protein BD770DRAFT_395877 [Pilaira anomala]